MKTLYPSRRHVPGGFTLIELLIVVAIMGMLAAFTMMGFGYATRQASRQKTEAFLKGITSGLEAYNSDYGEYPEAKSDPTTQFGQASYHVGGALMLYQALSGDGDSELKIASGGGHPSNGHIDDNEIEHQKLKEMPRDMWKNTNNGYMMVDGFGKPFQYTKYTMSGGGSHAATGQTVRVNTATVNNTYDLWSFADDDKNTSDVSLTTKQNPKISAKWIKNW